MREVSGVVADLGQQARRGQLAQPREAGEDGHLWMLLQKEPPHRLVLERYRSLTHTLEQQANQVFERDVRGHERSPAEREQLMGVFLDRRQRHSPPRGSVRDIADKAVDAHGMLHLDGLMRDINLARRDQVWLLVSSPAWSPLVDQTNGQRTADADAPVGRAVFNLP